jgi:hypothetical protein
LRYDFFRQRGRFFQTQPLSKGYRRRSKQCYYNSFKLAISREGLIYCEGFVVLDLGKGTAADIEHGWCVTTDGKVIDVTLAKPGLSYFGVTFSPEELADIDSVPLIASIIEKQLEAD